MIDDIANKINEMAAKDQKLRKKLEIEESKESLRKLRKLDKENTIGVKKIVDEIGLPTISKVGKEASYNAWLLVQHSPDLEFQKKYLRLMKENVDDINPKNIAYLTDRVLMYEGKKQIYGTQVVFDKKNQRYEPYDLENSDRVDKKRREVGLEPISEYMDMFNK